jgi:hypothetical protein
MKDGQKILCHIDGDIVGIWREAKFDEKFKSVVGEKFMFHIEQVTSWIDLETLTIQKNEYYVEPQQETYKYNILLRMQKLTDAEYKEARYELPYMCKVHLTTFRDWLYIKSDSEREIPAFSAIQIAKYFKCDVIDLYTSKSMFNPKSESCTK